MKRKRVYFPKLAPVLESHGETLCAAVSTKAIGQNQGASFAE
jgi:hypothetical protein